MYIAHLIVPMMGNVWVHASLWILRYECFIDIPYVKHCHVDAATWDNFRSTEKTSLHTTIQSQLMYCLVKFILVYEKNSLKWQ